MARIRIPANGWQPRHYQLDAWEYLEEGGKEAELIWHRRSGKDDISLHHTMARIIDRPANYWHMLPLANQARKAIWMAVNPHTGKRRIDEAFPRELRKTTRDNEMVIEFVNGGTWQVLGSDNYQGSIGSTPAGIVFSEWAQADPAARGYLRPILRENGGWWLFITTPRGRNHAYRTYESAKNRAGSFAQLLTVEDTGIFTEQQMAEELQAYIDDYDEDFGTALFNQEYHCSFDAAILGSYYGALISKMEREGRAGWYPHDPNHEVHTAWDLGRTDDTAIWWFQIIGEEIRIIDFHSSNGKSMAFYAGQILGHEVDLHISNYRVDAEIGPEDPDTAHRKAYNYGWHYLPHDANHKRLESAGKSARDQLAAAVGNQVEVLKPEAVQLGIQAVRMTFPRMTMHIAVCQTGLDAIRQYRREWKEEHQVLSPKPVHDWTSHPADALRTLAMAVRIREAEKQPEPEIIKPFTERWLEYDELKENRNVRVR